MRKTTAAAGVLALVTLAGCGATSSTAPATSQAPATTVPSMPQVSPTAAASPTVGAASGQPGAASATPTASSVMPRLRVEEVTSGLSIPWGLAFAPDGTMLFTERDGRLSAVRAGRTEPIQANLSEVRSAGEGGLMDIALSPAFASDRTAYLCHNTNARDVRVTAWTLSDDLRRATKKSDLVTGLPMSSGRHSGCRLLFGDDKMLYIGTGDAAQPTNPQNLTSLGGKVLRVDPATGEAPRDNPFAGAANAYQRLVWNYGHRNIQGLAKQPGTGQLFTVEHGSTVEDEINVDRKGANYGWNPAAASRDSYIEDGVPMTDTSLPNVVEALWNSGDATIATSGATFLDGPQWGALNGRLAVACLKGSQLMVIPVSAQRAGEPTVPDVLDGSYGRLRTAVQGPDGNLYLTTSNGDDDAILKVTPEGAA